MWSVWGWMLLPRARMREAGLSNRFCPSVRGKWKRRIRSDADTDADTDTDTNQNSFFSPLQCRTEAKHGYSLAKSCLLSLLLASFPGSPARTKIAGRGLAYSCLTSSQQRSKATCIFNELQQWKFELRSAIIDGIGILFLLPMLWQNAWVRFLHKIKALLIFSLKLIKLHVAFDLCWLQVRHVQ